MKFLILLHNFLTYFSQFIFTLHSVQLCIYIRNKYIRKIRVGCISEKIPVKFLTLYRNEKKTNVFSTCKGKRKKGKTVVQYQARLVLSVRWIIWSQIISSGVLFPCLLFGVENRDVYLYLYLKSIFKSPWPYRTKKTVVSFNEIH